MRNRLSGSPKILEDVISTHCSFTLLSYLYYFDIMLKLCSVGPVCGTPARGVNGTDLQCFQTPDMLCIANCVGNKVIFNATGNYDERYWMCQNFEWSPSYKIPDCVGKFSQAVATYKDTICMLM